MQPWQSQCAIDAIDHCEPHLREKVTTSLHDPATLLHRSSLSPSRHARRQSDDGTVSRRRLSDRLACDRWSWTKSTVGHKSPYVDRAPNNTWPAAADSEMSMTLNWLQRRLVPECGRPGTHSPTPRPITAATTTTNDHRLCVEERRALWRASFDLSRLSDDRKPASSLTT